MRKTFDLPDDLSAELEAVSKTLKIPQTTLLSIGGYQLVARYKTEGAGMFDRSSIKEEAVTLIDNSTTSTNIAFVRNHLKDFGTIKKIKVMGDQLPPQYKIPKIDGLLKYNLEYRLILFDEHGREWWFAGCSCGYGGEGVGGTHEILTILGVPFSWERLVSSRAIEESVEVDNNVYLTVSNMDSDYEVKFLIAFRSAVSLAKFKAGLSWLGYVRTSDVYYDRDLWAYNRNLALTAYSKGMDDQAFHVWIKDTLERIVYGDLGGSMKEIES